MSETSSSNFIFESTPRKQQTNSAVQNIAGAHQQSQTDGGRSSLPKGTQRKYLAGFKSSQPSRQRYKEGDLHGGEGGEDLNYIYLHPKKIDHQIIFKHNPKHSQ